MPKLPSKPPRPERPSSISHVRNDEGKVTCDPNRYAKARDLIRAAGCDVIINMSTGGGAGQTTDEQRAEPVTLSPEIASFDCGSLNFGAGVFVNSPRISSPIWPLR